MLCYALKEFYLRFLDMFLSDSGTRNVQIKMGKNSQRLQRYSMINSRAECRIELKYSYQKKCGIIRSQKRVQNRNGHKYAYYILNIAFAELDKYRLDDIDRSKQRTQSNGIAYDGYVSQKHNPMARNQHKLDGNTTRI